MLDIRKVVQDPESIIHNLRIRITGRDSEAAVNELVHLDTRRKSLLLDVEDLRRERNRASKAIGVARSQQPSDSDADVEDLIASVAEIKSELSAFEAELNQIEHRVAHFLDILPNVLHDSVPRGESEDDNPVIREWGHKTEFGFQPLDHKTIGENLGILDLPRGAKISGSGFPVYRGQGARLERALIQFMLDLHTTEHGFREQWVPFVVNRDSMRGTGQLPKFEKDLYWAEDGALGLIPTAEVPLTNLHRDEILPEQQLPLYLTAYSPCFRQEAGQQGEETRGLIRVHQFNKVELVKVVTPANSYDELESLTLAGEEVLRRLGLPYRVILLCSADTGFSAAKTYDIEVWLPSQQRYREISSCSNCTDFQARRMNLRYRSDDDGKTHFAHTLNGSGVAVGRCWVAIIENFQMEDGTVMVPEPLRPYLGGIDRIVPEADLPVGGSTRSFEGRHG